MGSVALIGMYLAAIVVANLTVAEYGQIALVFTALVLLPFDFLIRDVLHSRWESRQTWIVKMGVLILSGGLVSVAFNWDARWVAVGSCLAFCLAGAGNAALYAKMRGRRRYVRMNASNAVAAMVDSIVFPVVAFSVVDPMLCLAQFGMKWAGGLVISAAYCAAKGWDE